MDINNAKLVIDWIKKGKLSLKMLMLFCLVPFSLNLLLEGQSDLIRIETSKIF
jgi:Lhr-like helicase